MRIISLVACFLLVMVSAQADMTQNGRQPRQWDQAVSSVKLQGSGTDYTDNTSVFSNVAITGNNATGNPGYVALMATDSYGNTRSYYLWVDGSANSGAGALRMASFPNISQSFYTSFPYGDWRSNGGFTAGVKVSGQ